MNKLEITKGIFIDIETEKNKLAWKRSPDAGKTGKEFRTNGIHLRVQFRSFVRNQQHFIDEAFGFGQKTETEHASGFHSRETLYLSEIQTFQTSRFDRETHGLGCQLTVSRWISKP